jgi:probable rRNA maturation factor
MRTAAAETLRVAGVRFDAEINLVVVDDAEMQRLNKQYRDIDSVTDCLSFPIYDKPLPRYRKIPGKPRQVTVLGDIIICWCQARRQADEYGHTAERELAFLTAHSALHLCGFTHDTAQGEKEMFGLQEAVLLKIGLGR